jgi:hypothetical protein
MFCAFDIPFVESLPIRYRAEAPKALATGGSTVKGNRGLFEKITWTIQGSRIHVTMRYPDGSKMVARVRIQVK